jgi:hypothetical protein
LRKQIFLIGLFILWAAAAHGGAGSEATGLDILGSEANNTTIIAPNGMPVEVNIIGSTASNIHIGRPEKVIDRHGKECWGCAPCGEEKRYETPWDDFKRPLCYPWSSYIPTRYNRPLIRKDQAYINTAPKILTLGSVTTKT